MSAEPHTPPTIPSPADRESPRQSSRHGDGDEQLQDLSRRLAEAEATIQALIAGQVDAVLDREAATPLLLRQAQQALRESEERFSKAFHSNPAPITISRLNDGRLIDVNDSYLRLTGYRREEVIGRTPGELQVWTSPADHSSMVQGLREKGRLRDVEVSVRAKSGELRNVVASLELIEIGGEPCMLAMLYDLTERKRAEAELSRSRQQLRDLAAHLQSAREETRTRIAREIHDELGQTLTGLKMDLSWLKNNLAKAGDGAQRRPLLKKLTSMLKLVDSTIQSMRRLAAELRPAVLDELGLVAAIAWQAQEFHQRTGTRCQFSAQPEDITLDGERKTAVFRICQEALTNVARHAHATQVNVSLTQDDDQIRLVVSDNGQGISEPEIGGVKSLGLLGMRERASLLGGEVKISGAPGQGTTVTLWIPLERDNDQSSGRR